MSYRTQTHTHSRAVRTVTKDSITVAQQFPGHVLGTIAIVGNKEGSHAVTSSLDCQLRLLNLATGAVEKTVDAGPGELWQIAYSPDETRLASGSQQGKINLFDLDAEKLVQEIPTQAKLVLSVAYVRGVTSATVARVEGSRLAIH